MPWLYTFPWELIYMIFRMGARANKQTALALACVSSAVREKVTPIIYEVVALHPRSGEDIQGRADAFRRALEANPRLAGFVKALLHQSNCHNENLDILRMCKHARRLHLQSWDGDGVENFQPHPDGAGDLEVNFHNPLNFPYRLQVPLFLQVTRLIFQLDLPTAMLVEAIIQIPCLTHLSLRFSRDGANNNFQLDHDAIKTLLGSPTLQLVHLYFRTSQTAISPPAIEAMHRLSTITDDRLLVGMGNSWGGWMQWRKFYEERRNIWAEIVEECMEWRQNVQRVDWLMQPYQSRPHV